MNIRKAQRTDAKQIFNLETICFTPDIAATYPEIEEQVSVFGNHFWLLFDKNRLISYINGPSCNQKNLTDQIYSDTDLHEEKGLWQFVLGLGTLPEYRGTGIAGKMLNEMIADTKEDGRKGIVLACEKHLISYYERFGFINEGISESDRGGRTWYQMRLTF